MGAISLYNQVIVMKQPKQPVVVEEYNNTFAGEPILSDAKEVTLAEYSTTTKNAITAHHLKDYRRKTFRLTLLPKISTLFDKVLEGSDYWNALLHVESPYS